MALNTGARVDRKPHPIMNLAASLHRAAFADPYGTLSLLRRLWHEHGVRYWRSYLATYVLMGIIAGSTALFATLLGRAVNETYFRENFAAIATFCVAAIVLFSARGFATYAQAVLLARIGNQISADTQKRMFDKILQHGLVHFDARHSSDYTAQLTYGCMGIAGILNLLICASGRDLLLLISLVVVMLREEPLLSLMGLMLMPPALLVLRRLTRQVKAAADRRYSGGRSVLTALQETLQGMRVVKAFRLEERLRGAVHHKIDFGKQAADDMARLSNRPTPLMETLGGFAVAGIFLYAAWRIGSNQATPGAFVAFCTSFLLAYEPAKRLARVNIDLANYLLPARALFEFLDAPPTEPDDSDKRALAVCAGRIEFAGVVFAYRPDQPVIRGMSFVADSGRRTALVGASGGGKSTTLSLMLRLYDAQEGAILIDGQDIAACSRASVREQIAYVGQDAFLFSGSVADNIGCGKPDAQQPEIEEAAKAAHLHEFIQTLRDGYDTYVGENGAQLSGGQRQRVATARALIKDAPIILLDEATASLDSESERDVREAITRLCQNRTTLIVAHRLHTIEQADKIVVVENGTVVEEGQHAELLNRNGRYAAFYGLQIETSAREEAPKTEPVKAITAAAPLRPASGTSRIPRVALRP
jgi:ATP-binding cassette subfamily B protein